MRSFALMIMAGTLCAAGFATAGSASVMSSGDTSFTFAGMCSDCSGTATGTLVLNNYMLGDPISGTNFVSFTYDGTDLLDPYTVTASNVSFVSGSIVGPLPAAENFFVNGSTGFFSSTSDGNWCTGNSCFADYGVQHAWSAATTSPAPEPASWALMIGGFGMVGGAMRRRKATVRFA